MSTPFDDSPEDLVALRATVEEWLEKAMEAVWSFHHRDGSFWRDTRQPDEKKKGPSSLTASARAHMAMAYAGRYKEEALKEYLSDWIEGFKTFISDDRLVCNGSDKLKDSKNKDKENKAIDVNNFELAHLAWIIHGAP